MSVDTTVRGPDNAWRIVGDYVTTEGLRNSLLGVVAASGDPDPLHVCVRTQHTEGLFAGMTLWLCDIPASFDHDAPRPPHEARLKVLHPTFVRTALLQVEEIRDRAFVRCRVHQSAYRKLIPAGTRCYVIPERIHEVKNLMRIEAMQRGRKKPSSPPENHS